MVVKKEKPQRKYIRYRIITGDDFLVTFFDIGFYSPEQRQRLLDFSINTLKGIIHDTNSWKIPCPKNSPKKGSFVMVEDEIIKF